MRRLVLYQKILLLAALTAFSNVVAARDIGTIGPTYQILERDLVDLIKDRLNQKKSTGELDALNQQMKSRGKQYAARPQGITLPPAAEYKAIALNPLYTLDKDIADANGKILYFKGTQVNPLKLKPLTKSLCFFDGDDEKQVQWILQFCAKEKKNKLIMINGDYLALSKKTQLRLYFDQRGFLVNRFGITAVPSVVRQSGEVLYVEAFPVN
mgnify:CR=1 FL=1